MERPVAARYVLIVAFAPRLLAEDSLLAFVVGELGSFELLCRFGNYEVTFRPSEQL